MGLSGSNFRPNQASTGASIFNNGSQRPAAKNPKLQLKSNRVDGEIVDVDYRSLGQTERGDGFSRNERQTADIAYRNTLFAKVEQQKKDIEERRQRQAKESKASSKEWQVRIDKARESGVERQMETELAEHLKRIDSRLAYIEEALGINGGTKNFKPSSLPGSNQERMEPNPNVNYSKHVSDYSSMIKNIQDLHNFKRDMGNA